MNVEKLLERKKKLEADLKAQSLKIKQVEAANKRKKVEHLAAIIVELGLEDFPPDDLRSALSNLKKV